MKLPIKKKYLDKIKAGIKKFEWRDAHITFICEETKEQLTVPVISAGIIKKYKLPKGVADEIGFTDENIIEFELE